jgi:hypothetical protein
VVDFGKRNDDEQATQTLALPLVDEKFHKSLSDAMLLTKACSSCSFLVLRATLFCRFTTAHNRLSLRRWFAMKPKSILCHL